MAKYRISGVPITEGRKLVGIITNRDLKFETDFSRKIKECMTSEGLITAKEGITLEDAKKILAKSRKEKLPIVDDDFNLKRTHYHQGYRETDQISACSQGCTGTSSLWCGSWYHSQCTCTCRCTCESECGCNRN